MPNWIDCKLIVEGDTKNFDDFACIRLLRDEKDIVVEGDIIQAKIKDGITFEFRTANTPPINYVNHLSIRFDLGFRLTFYDPLGTWCGEFISDRRGRYDWRCDKTPDECDDCVNFPCNLCSELEPDKKDEVK